MHIYVVWFFLKLYPITIYYRHEYGITAHFCCFYGSVAIRR